VGETLLFKIFFRLWSTIGRRSHQLPQSPLRVGTDEVIPTSVVRDLGIYIDSDVSIRLVAKSEQRPRNHFRGDGMLAAGTHVGWLI